MLERGKLERHIELGLLEGFAAKGSWIVMCHLLQGVKQVLVYSGTAVWLTSVSTIGQWQCVCALVTCEVM